MTKHKVFMSYKHRAIWYGVDDDGDIYYMVAKGDGTDEYFVDWKDAMNWIEAEKSKANKARLEH